MHKKKLKLIRILQLNLLVNRVMIPILLGSLTRMMDLKRMMGHPLSFLILKHARMVIFLKRMIKMHPTIITQKLRRFWMFLKPFHLSRGYLLTTIMIKQMILNLFIMIIQPNKFLYILLSPSQIIN
jgi:hypothetical protein